MTSTLWMTMPRLYCAAGSFLLPLLRNWRFTSYSIRALNTVFHNLTHVTIEGERRERRQSVRRFWMEFDLKSEPTLSAQRRSRPWDARCTLDSTLRRVLYSKRKSKDISLSPQSTHQCVITNRRKRRSTLDHWASGVWLHFTTFGGAMWEVKKTFSQSPWHFAGREWSWKVELSLSLCLDCNFTPSVRTLLGSVKYAKPKREISALAPVARFMQFLYNSAVSWRITITSRVRCRFRFLYSSAYR